jgi:hypothetical protein
LAIAWGLASPVQAAIILDKMAALGMAYPVPTQVTSQPYGSAFIAIENRLAGIPHYHTAAAWIWLGAWHVAALVRSGRLAEAYELLERMSAVIVRDGVVHEVYGKHGHHLSTRWYTSEAPPGAPACLFMPRLCTNEPHGAILMRQERHLDPNRCNHLPQDATTSIAPRISLDNNRGVCICPRKASIQ